MIDKGCAVKLAAPLPDEIQNVTSYDAAAICVAAITGRRAQAGREPRLGRGEENLRRNGDLLASFAREVVTA